MLEVNHIIRGLGKADAYAKKGEFWRSIGELAEAREALDFQIRFLCMYKTKDDLGDSIKAAARLRAAVGLPDETLICPMCKDTGPPGICCKCGQFREYVPGEMDID